MVVKELCVLPTQEVLCLHIYNELTFVNECQCFQVPVNKLQKVQLESKLEFQHVRFD